MKNLSIKVIAIVSIVAIVGLFFYTMSLMKNDAPAYDVDKELEILLVAPAK